ncbi:MAG: hypothetical protein E7235_06445 [Lachnospiraceae bacterium]|nr:hypothetical protein [Lachnospiraceae bacterium]
MKLKLSTKILLIAILLTVIAIAFVAFAFSHPELGFPVSIRTTLIIYGVYIAVTVLLYVIAIMLKKFEGRKK